MWPNPQETEEILNGELHFCAVPGVEDDSNKKAEKPNKEFVIVVESQPLKQFELSQDFSLQQWHRFNGIKS